MSHSTPQRLCVLLCLLLAAAGQVLAQADLSLSLSQDPDAPRQYTDYTVTATVTNDGPETATGVRVELPRVPGTVYTGGREAIASQGRFRPYSTQVWTVGALAPGERATLQVNLFLLAAEAPAYYAQVTASDQADPDSTPGNGTAPAVNEDDEASTDAPAGPVCDLTITVGEVTCVDNPDAQFPSFTAMVTVTSASRGGLGNAVLDVPNRRDPFSTRPVGYGSPARYEISADQIVDGRFTVIASAGDQSGCEQTGSFVYPAECDGGGGTDEDCPFVSEPVIAEGFPRSIEQVGSRYVVSTRTFDADFRPDTDFAYEFDGTGQLLSADSRPAEDAGRIQVDATVAGGEFVRLYRVTEGGADTLARFVNPRVQPAGQSPNVARVFTTPDGYLVLVSYQTSEGFGSVPREEFGYSAITVDAAFNEIGSATYALGSPFPFEGIDVYGLDNGDVAVISNGLSASEALIIQPDATLRVRFDVFQRTGRPNFLDGFRRLSNGGYGVVYRLEGSVRPQYAAFDMTGARVGGFQLDERALDGSEGLTGGYLLLPEGGFAVIGREPGPTPGTVANRVLVYGGDGVLRGSYVYPELQRTRLFGLDDAGNLLAYASATSADGFSSEPPGRLVRFDRFGRLTCEKPTPSSGVDLAVFLPEPLSNPATRTLYNLTVEVRNQGDADATGVTLAGVYLNPDQQLNSSGDGTFERGPVAVPAGESRFFTLTLIAVDLETPGLYVQVAAQDQPDADSTPGNGTPPAVNEDDEAASTTIALPEGIDLALEASTTAGNPGRFTNYTITYTLRNDGDDGASGITVSIPTPEGQVLTGGNEFTASQGTFSPYGTQVWSVGALEAGATATLDVNYFRLADQPFVAYGQVATANEEDFDSTPGNGNGRLAAEDDEANINFAGSQFAKAALHISPNPMRVDQSLQIDLGREVAEDFDAELIVSDLNGRVIVRRDVRFGAGSEVLSVDLAGLTPGVYVVSVPERAVTPQRLIVR